MREVISLHVGQAGVAASNSLWQLYCIEHGVDTDGKIKFDQEYSQGSGFNSFFKQIGDKASPRALLVDLDCSTIDRALDRNGCLLFGHDEAVSGLEDSGSNYAKARYGKESNMLVSETMRKLRRMAEGSSNIHGFMVQHGLGGGTGSGVICSILNKMHYAFPKKSILQFSIFPCSKFSTSIVEPYNTILGVAAIKSNNKCCVLSTNQAMFKYLGRNDLSSSSDYKDINILWNYAIGTTTASMRHGGEISTKLSDVVTNLVPRPNLRFPFMSYAPAGTSIFGLRTNDVIRDCFNSKSHFLECDMSRGKYFAANVAACGVSSPQEVNNELASLTSSGGINFATWSRNSFKIGVSSRSSGKIPGSLLTPGNVSVCGLHATTAIIEPWKDLLKNYRTMLRRRAFLHWYLSEGMEVEEFHKAEIKMIDLLDQYKNIAN